MDGRVSLSIAVTTLVCDGLRVCFFVHENMYKLHSEII
jgi:hypothetical protein